MSTIPPCGRLLAVSAFCSRHFAEPEDIPSKPSTALSLNNNNNSLKNLSLAVSVWLGQIQAHRAAVWPSSGCVPASPFGVCSSSWQFSLRPRFPGRADLISPPPKYLFQPINLNARRCSLPPSRRQKCIVKTNESCCSKYYHSLCFHQANIVLSVVNSISDRADFDEQSSDCHLSFYLKSFPPSDAFRLSVEIPRNRNDISFCQKFLRLLLRLREPPESAGWLCNKLKQYQLQGRNPSLQRKGPQSAWAPAELPGTEASLNPVERGSGREKRRAVCLQCSTGILETSPGVCFDSRARSVGSFPESRSCRHPQPESVPDAEQPQGEVVQIISVYSDIIAANLLG